VLGLPLRFLFALLELPAIDPSEGWGCDWHPSIASHTRFGGLVADRLRTDLGW
jgi:hypothetical protein